MKGVNMKAYEQILQMIDKLDHEDIKLELAIDDGVENFHKAKDQYTMNKVDEYLTKLREQRKEVYIRGKIHTRSLNFYGDDKDDYKAFVSADGLIVKTYITAEEMPAFATWIYKLMSEVK